MGAALLIRTFIALRTVNPGFDAHNVLVAKMSLADPRFQKTAGVAKLVRDGLQSLNALPGVLTAGAACCVPLEGNGFLSFTVVGRPLSGPNHGYAGWTNVSSAYFDIFKIPLLRGRAFTDRDDVNAPGAVIINQAMARQFWRKAIRSETASSSRKEQARFSKNQPVKSSASLATSRRYGT